MTHLVRFGTATVRFGTAAVATAVLLSATVGCQTTVGGLALPSPYYIDDDLQYFAEGTEFKLSREAAAQQALKAQREAGTR